mmetsp:Transcript_45872/g.139061  ORF Transcript_45872/g.139061 Transcript_45872/m.139061 type:complete len:172 (-) Transcript_45872:91-606(-)
MEEWRQDKFQLWWNGEDGPYDDKYERVPWTPEEILPVVREVAIQCNTAALCTVCAASGFPRSRTVSPRHYISPDFTSVSVATRANTRKIAEIQACDKVSLFWKDESGKGGWILAMGRGAVELDPDGEKAKVKLTVERLEVQDYNKNIMGNGLDNWKCCILEREDGKWVKRQ